MRAQGGRHARHARDSNTAACPLSYTGTIPLCQRAALRTALFAVASGMQKTLYTILQGGPMRKLLGALLLAVAAACNDSTGPGSGTLSGSYQLRTANGVVVPGIASQDVSGVYEVLRGRIVLRSDFSFVDSLSDRFTPTGGAAQPRIDVRIGTYVQTGNNVTLSFNSSTGLVSYSLTWIDPNTLAYAEPELSLIYAK